MGVWELRDTTFTAPAGTAYASVVWGPNGSPATGVQLYGDDLKIAPVPPTQVFTVTRSVNGISKAQASGAAVSLAYPAYTAL